MVVTGIYTKPGGGVDIACADSQSYIKAFKLLIYVDGGVSGFCFGRHQKPKLRTSLYPEAIVKHVLEQYRDIDIVKVEVGIDVFDFGALARIIDFRLQGKPVCEVDVTEKAEVKS